jgi:hypothetical protein
MGGTEKIPWTLTSIPAKDNPFAPFAKAYEEAALRTLRTPPSERVKMWIQNTQSGNGSSSRTNKVTYVDPASGALTEI